MRRHNPGMRVLYVRSEQFFSAMMKALQDKAMDGFKRQFQQVDALLIDDIQFFAGKDRTQEEFFHTFNALFDGKQQIRSEENTSELQSLMRISYAVFCLQKKNIIYIK